MLKTILLFSFPCHVVMCLARCLKSVLVTVELLIAKNSFNKLPFSFSHPFEKWLMCVDLIELLPIFALKSPCNMNI